jgi:hypothetical protein
MKSSLAAVPHPHRKTTKEILNFWRDVEIFVTPPPAKLEKPDNYGNWVGVFQPGDRLPWEDERGTNSAAAQTTTQRVYTVFIGVADAVDWARVVLGAVSEGAPMNEGDYQRISGLGCLGLLRVNGNGEIDPKSLVPATFPFGISRVMQRLPLDGISADVDGYVKSFTERFQAPESATPEGMRAPDQRSAGTVEGTAPEPDPPPTAPLTWKQIEAETKALLALTGKAASQLRTKAVIKCKVRRAKDPAGQEDQDVDFLNSFYLDDLDRLIKLSDRPSGFGPALQAYLGAASPPSSRRDTLRDHSAMRMLVSPDTMPPGRWPSSKNHPLSLAQQAAVAVVGTQGGLIAVNGPPGTGKTTLLRDVIANVVVDRARALTHLDKPRDLFGSKIVVGGMGVYPIGLAGGTGIVVTSNNNSAVENITHELPALKSVATKEHEGAAYFKQVANNLFKKSSIEQHAWGLVAGALGNMGNRRIFADALYNDRLEEYSADQEASDLRSLLEAQDDETATTAWYARKREFQAINEAVEVHLAKHREWEQILIAVRPLERQLDEARQDLMRAESSQHAELSAARDELAAAQTAEGEAKRAAESASEIAASMEDLVQIAESKVMTAQTHRPPRLWDRLLHLWFGIVTKRQEAWDFANAAARSAHEAALEGRISARKRNAAATDAFAKAQGDAKNRALALRQLEVSWQAKIKAATRACEVATLELDEAKGRAAAVLAQAGKEGVHIPSDEFFSRPSDERHRTSVWRTAELDELRAKLFLSALALHEWSLRACKNLALPNLRAVNRMLRNELPESIRQEDRMVLWDLLFFAVPVVSTALASFRRLFGRVDAEDLGWLLVDEAGQATPQSVAGAIWRSRNAVVIGDPLQVEPVVPLPGAVIERLRTRHRADVEWSPLTESAQTLADRTMSFGAYIGGSTWTGLPLRAHRRCIDPMFKVANEIAYSNQMAQANTSPDTIECVLGASAWFDVRGTTSNGPVVQDELDVLRRCLRSIKREWPTHGPEATASSVFVISPFAKVQKDCKSLLWREDMAEMVACGTVHKFQGREAEVVFIVLGSAPGEAGAGSRAWASAKPNILNVALTRAKLRVYVIGSVEDWGGCKGFDTLLRELEDAGRVIGASGAAADRRPNASSMTGMLGSNTAPLITG